MVPESDYNVYTDTLPSMELKAFWRSKRHMNTLLPLPLVKVKAKVDDTAHKEHANIQTQLIVCVQIPKFG